MRRWKRLRLENLAQVTKGRVLPTSAERIESTVQYLGAADLEGGDSGLYVSAENAVLCDSDDLLLLWDGERSGLVGCGLSGAVSSTVARIRPIGEQVTSRFLYHHLRWRFTEIQSLRTGTGVPHVPRDLQTFFSVLVPPLEEQYRIAEILDDIDETIRASNRLVEKLDSIALALSYSHFMGANLRCLARLGNECRVLGGKRLPAGHNYSQRRTRHRYLRVVDFYQRSVNYDGLAALDESTFEALKRYEIRSGELFVSIAGSIGYVGVNRPPDDMRTILTENAARIIPSDSFVPSYLALQMNSPAIASQVKASIGTGGGVPKLALHRLANIRVNCPDFSTQSEIARRHESVSAVREFEVRRIDKLTQLRFGLADDLLTGRVRTVAA